jgi:Cu(I)/Ag(I) efflux system protein CusF
MNMKKEVLAGILALSAAALSFPAVASDNKSHGGSHGSVDHSAMKAPESTDETEVTGVINSVDAEKGMINVTHEPVEALGWPKMTMDLPVTRRVDLSTVEAGSNVKFKLKQGQDKQFRVIDIEKVN